LSIRPLRTSLSALRAGAVTHPATGRRLPRRPRRGLIGPLVRILARVRQEWPGCCETCGPATLHVAARSTAAAELRAMVTVPIPQRVVVTLARNAGPGAAGHDPSASRTDDNPDTGDGNEMRVHGPLFIPASILGVGANPLNHHHPGIRIRTAASFQVCDFPERVPLGDRRQHLNALKRVALARRVGTDQDGEAGESVGCSRSESS